jgi:hypothetical protein
MCQYEAEDGFVTTYHTVHYGRRPLPRRARTAACPRARIEDSVAFAQAVIAASGQADLVGIGREALREPNVALRAKQALGTVNPEHPFDNWPPQIGWC